MKRLLASLMIVPLLLVACSDDEGKDKDQSSNKDQTTQKDKKVDQDKQKEKDNKAKDDKAKDEQSKDNSATSGNNEGTDNGQSTNDTQQNQASNDNGNEQNQTSPSSSQSKPTYVAPYQGQNVAPVAQNIVRQQVDRQQALKNLPNFQTSLDNAQAEVNRFNGQNNPYNDYALQGDGGHYSYMFSFINQSQPGTYTVVTVDGTGQAKIVDPAYRQ